MSSWKSREGERKGIRNELSELDPKPSSMLSLLPLDTDTVGGIHLIPSSWSGLSCNFLSCDAGMVL
jgi:hypothetical protein